jgi:hypothetical protein
MAVYFIRPIGMDGPTKIGSSNLPRVRLEAFLPWCPFPLEIVCQIEGGQCLEMRFHAKFQHLHTHREWFRASPEIDETIDQIKAGLLDVSALPRGAYLTRATVGKPRNAHQRATQSLSMRTTCAQRRSRKPLPREIEIAARNLCTSSGAERERIERTLEDYIALWPKSDRKPRRKAA